MNAPSQDNEPLQELDEDRLWPHDPDGPSWAPILEEAPVPKKRGRKKIPELWTRVISISHDQPEDLATYVVAEDLETKDERLIYPRNRRNNRDDWKPLFQPKTYAREHTDMNLD